MRGYQYTFTNRVNGKSFSIGLDDSGQNACLVGHGAILQDNPSFELEVRNDEKLKSGQHGIWDFFSFYGKRNITFSGIILATDWANLITAENKMREVLTLPVQPIAGVDDGYINLSWTDALGLTWNVDAKIKQDLIFSRNQGERNKCSFFLSLKTEDPFILSTTLYDQTGLMGWRQGGSALPLFLPSSFTVQYKNLMNLYQQGTSEAPATYRLYGPAINPQLTKYIESYTSNSLISNFDASWVGGMDDTQHYLSGTSGRKLTSVNGSADSMTLTGSFDLGPPEEFITFYFYVDDVDNFAWFRYAYTQGDCYVKFSENVGADEFIAEFDLGNNTIKTGWNYFRLLKDNFKIVGVPSWNDITQIEFSIKSKAGTTLNVTFDDLYSRSITLAEQKMEITYVLSAGEYLDIDIAEGTILHSNGTDLSSYLTFDSTWFYMSPGANLLQYESDNSSPLITYTYPYIYNDPVMETGLVSYYHFDEQTLTDYSASGNDGAGVGAINYMNSSVHGSIYSLELDGATYFEAPITFDPLGIETATIVCWRQFNSFASSDYTFSQILGNSGTGNLYYDQGTNKLKFEVKLDGVLKTVEVVNFSASHSIDTWYCIMITLDTTAGIKLYINNVLAAQDTSTGLIWNSGVSNMRFGTNNTATTFGEGQLDEVRVYSTALTADERQVLIDNPAQNKLAPQVDISWYYAML